MKSSIVSALLGTLILSGCAAGVTVGPTEPIGSQTYALSSGDAAAIAHEWCRENGYRCEIDDVDLVDQRRVWRVELEAERPRSNGRALGHKKAKGKGHEKAKGKGHWKHDDAEETDFVLAIDARSGRIIDVRRGH